MKRVRLALLFLAATSAGTARAADICSTISDCRTLQAKVNDRLAVLLKITAPSLMEVVRNADGSIRRMNDYDAHNYCSNLGTRLPSARELAFEAQKLGAEGISDAPRDGFSLIGGPGSTDSFYYSYFYYKRPDGYLGNEEFWSSSYPYDGNGTPYLLAGGDGSLVYHDIHSHCPTTAAVRCVRPR